MNSRTATASTSNASANRSFSAGSFWAALAPNWAPITPPMSSSTASTISTDLVFTACSKVVAAVTATICISEVPITTPACMPSR